ncbi:uncharacterized protein LOC105833365 [Monomorium pharaonis]|uniref:uncharacterized protein LOC105833365 n=1 Tax=Monomorium pharaonis TaxID=307658 RepID=UPI00063F4DBF|nr:uncharacterized protein LOC105833365 [Monomorium pharaonis]
MCLVVGLTYKLFIFITKRRKMKRVAFFVLALIVIVVANDDKEEIARKFDTDAITVQGCLDDIGTKMEELDTSLQKWSEVKDDDVNEETKQSLMKYVSFLTCMLEKNKMMIDAKFVVDKVVESVLKDKDLETIPPKEVLTECITALNDDSEMTREDRVFGLMLCIMGGVNDGDRR